MTDLIAAVTAAEDRARANHEAGICHLDEWSCTACEEGGVVSAEHGAEKAQKANLLTGCAAAGCARTWHSEHGGAVPGGPFPGTQGEPGDVRRCEHGKVWRFRRIEQGWSWFDLWDRVSPWWEPITYRRAIRAFPAAKRTDYLLDGSPESVAVVREARGLPPIESREERP